MKKYIVKYIKDNKILGEYTSRQGAAIGMMMHINAYNEVCKVDERLTPFDFVLEEVEYREVNKVIIDFETARKAINLKPNDDFMVVKKKHSENIMQIEDVAWLVNELNPKHIEALIALNELFTIAEAWNKADGFVPDFSDGHQDKWFPWFNYDNDAARFVYTAANFTPANVGAPFGSRLCFKTRERAKQFGKQFVELYNEVFVMRNFIKTLVCK